MSIDPRLLPKLACPKESTCLGLSRYCLDVHECDVNALKAAFGDMQLGSHLLDARTATRGA
jgi:hypothetical protein